MKDTGLTAIRPVARIREDYLESFRELQESPRPHELDQVHRGEEGNGMDGGSVDVAATKLCSFVYQHPGQPSNIRHGSTKPGDASTILTAMPANTRLGDGLPRQENEKKKKSQEIHPRVFFASPPVIQSLLMSVGGWCVVVS